MDIEIAQRIVSEAACIYNSALRGGMSGIQGWAERGWNRSEYWDARDLICEYVFLKNFKPNTRIFNIDDDEKKLLVWMLEQGC